MEQNNKLVDLFALLAKIMRIKLGNDKTYKPTEIANAINQITPSKSGTFNETTECFVANGILGINTIIIDEGVTSIAHNAYKSLSNLENLFILGKITSIGNSAFSGCTLLKKIDLSYVKTIGSYAFTDCSNLTDITFGKELSSINIEALTSTGWYKNKPNGPIYINNILYSLKGDNVGNGGNFIIEENTNSISRVAFANKKSIKTIEGTTKKGIGEDAFANCVNLKSAKFYQTNNDSIFLSASAFYNCSNLETLHIDNLLYAERDILQGCVNLKNIYILNEANIPNKLDFLQAVKGQATIHVHGNLEERWRTALGDGYTIKVHTESS